MTARGVILLSFLCLVPAVRVAGQAPHQHPGPADPGVKLGRIEFPTSGSAGAQDEFLRGVLYLHSFEYESAERAFRRAQGLDPGFVMAYWGEAMTHTHPVWNEQDVPAARNALERLAPTPDARRAMTPSERERAYLAAVELLYGSGSKAQRDTLYAAAMERLVRQYPADLEAKAFYSLALLGLNQGVRDTSTYLRAAAYADTVFRANPDHPGGAHYLIHAYDDPLHAGRGLVAARAYARIAPDAAHAQHMTTHIFLALGMWDDMVRQNRIAVGLTASLPGHYTGWLVYGMIQQGRYEAAHQLIEQLRRNLNGAGTPPQLSALAEMRAHWLLHSEDWNSPVARWRLDRHRMVPTAQLIDAFTEGVIAYRRGDAGALSAAAVALTALADTLSQTQKPETPSLIPGRVMIRELEAMGQFLNGSRQAAVRTLMDAAALADALPMDFGPPALVEPPHELLGAMALETDAREALAQYQRALVLGPGRSRALQGAAEAAVASGNRAEAQRALDRLTANWRSGDQAVRDRLTSLQRAVGRLP